MPFQRIRGFILPSYVFNPPRVDFCGRCEARGWVIFFPPWLIKYPNWLWGKTCPVSVNLLPPMHLFLTVSRKSWDLWGRSFYLVIPLDYLGYSYALWFCGDCGVRLSNSFLFCLKGFIYLLEREREREREQDRASRCSGGGRGRSSLPIEQGAWHGGSIPGPQDHDPNRRQTLNWLDRLAPR